MEIFILNCCCVYINTSLSALGIHSSPIPPLFPSFFLRLKCPGPNSPPRIAVPQARSPTCSRTRCWIRTPSFARTPPWSPRRTTSPRRTWGRSSLGWARLSWRSQSRYMTHRRTLRGRGRSGQRPGGGTLRKWASDQTGCRKIGRWSWKSARRGRPPGT